MGISGFEFLITTLDLIFNFWFVIILFPLQNRKNSIEVYLAFWSFLAFIRILLLFSPYPTIKSFFIAEPFNTILFFVVGLIIAGIWLGKKQLLTNKYRSMANGLTINQILELSPGEFEEMTAELYRARGHKARKTGNSGDHGVDVFVKSKEGNTMIVQCKRWRRPVGEAIVREFYGTMQHEKAMYGTIFGVSGFTQKAKEWAKGKPIALYDGSKFIEMWEEAEIRKINSETFLRF